MVFVLYLLTIAAHSISTLYMLNYPLHWTPGRIGNYQAVSMLSYGISLLFVLPLIVALRVPDSVIIIVGVLWTGVSYV